MKKLSIIPFLFPVLAFAGTAPSLNAEFGLGFSQLVNQPDTNVKTIAGFSGDLYHPNEEDSAFNGVLGLGVSWQWQRHWLPFSSIMAEAQFANANRIDGKIKQFNFAWNYNYELNYRHQSYLLNFEQGLFSVCKVTPFIILGAGFTHNEVNGYQESGIGDIFPRDSLAFKANANIAFAYQLGIGLSVPLQQHLSFSVQYRYLNSGSLSLKPGTVRAGIYGPKVKANSNIFFGVLNYRF